MDDAANPLNDSAVSIEAQQKVDQNAPTTEQALASVSAGRAVSEEVVDAWMDSLDTKHELPPPRFGR